jgi:hypothetical protein
MLDVDGPTDLALRGLERDQELLNALEKSKAALERVLNANTQITDQHVTGYGETNEFEDFADTVAMYLLDPAKLKAIAPQRWDFMEKLFGVSQAGT